MSDPTSSSDQPPSDSSDQAPADLRQALVRTRDYAIRKAWVALIQGLRAHKRGTGEASPLSSRGAVEQLLDRPPRPGLSIEELDAIDADLRALVRGDLDDVETMQTAVRAAERLQAAAARIAQDPVKVELRGLHPDLSHTHLRRLIGHHPDDLAHLDPLDATRLIAKVHGLDLAGLTVEVHVELPEGTLLPSLPRGERNRSRRNPHGPWLPHVDTEGLRSVTPQHLARGHAQLFVDNDVDVVIDAYGGCGGDTVAMAEAGLRVHCIERAPGRLQLLAANVEELDLSSHVRIHEGDALELAPRLLAERPAAGLFLDPPWHITDGALAATYEDLVPAELRELLQVATVVVLELPRGFDVSTLPDRPGGWSWRPGFGTDSTGDYELVKLLTAWSVA